MRQFLRKTRVTFFNGFTVNPSPYVQDHELRVSFDISKSISSSPNTFELNIWNLNPDNRNSIGKELEEIQIEAGYVPPEGGGNLSIVGKGFIRDVQHDRDGPDIITKITCGDGDKAFRKSTISETKPSGTPVTDIVETIHQKMSEFGVDRGEWIFPEEIKTMKRPYSMCGGCFRELNVLGRSNNFYWSIQNGVLEIIPSNGFLYGETLINSETGMIGVPTITDNGVKVKCLLNPQIRPNRIVKVQSQFLQMNAQDDRYRVSKVDMKGDNMQGDFITSVHGESISDNEVDEGVLK